MRIRELIKSSSKDSGSDSTPTATVNHPFVCVLFISFVPPSWPTAVAVLFICRDTSSQKTGHDRTTSGLVGSGSRMVSSMLHNTLGCSFPVAHSRRPIKVPCQMCRQFYCSLASFFSSSVQPSGERMSRVREQDSVQSKRNHKK